MEKGHLVWWVQIYSVSDCSAHQDEKHCGWGDSIAHLTNFLVSYNLGLLSMFRSATSCLQINLVKLQSNQDFYFLPLMDFFLTGSLGTSQYAKVKNHWAQIVKVWFRKHKIYFLQFPSTIQLNSVDTELSWGFENGTFEAESRYWAAASLLISSQFIRASCKNHLFKVKSFLFKSNP